MATLAFSPDRSRLYTDSDSDGVGIVWDISSGRQLFTFNGEGGLDAIAVSPDGTSLAMGEFDTTLKIWDATTGNKLLTFFGHASYLYGVVYSPDGKWLATSGNDATIKVWDSITGVEVFSLIGHTGPTFGVAFSPDGQYLATSSVDRTVKVWQLPKGGEQVPEPLTVYDNAGAVDQVAFSPAGTRVVSVGRDRIIHMFVLNIEDLIVLARSRLTRELTQKGMPEIFAPGCISIRAINVWMTRLRFQPFQMDAALQLYKKLSSVAGYQKWICSSILDHADFL